MLESPESAESLGFPRFPGFPGKRGKPRVSALSWKAKRLLAFLAFPYVQKSVESQEFFRGIPGISWLFFAGVGHMLEKICSNGLKKCIHTAKIQILREKKIKCKAMVIYTTKLLIDGLSLKIQYFSRAFRMSWSCFLTLSITVNLRFCTPQFLKCLTEGMFFVPPLISLRCCVPRW